MLADLLPTMQGAFDLTVLMQADPPRRWIPNTPGDTCKGDVLARFDATEDYGRGPVIVPTVMLCDRDGITWLVRGTSAQLARLIEEQNPRPGDRFGAQYKGQGIGRESGRVYKRYIAETRYRLANGALGIEPDDTGE